MLDGKLCAALLSTGIYYRSFFRFCKSPFNTSPTIEYKITLLKLLKNLTNLWWILSKMKQKYGWKWFLSVFLPYLCHSELLSVPYHFILYGRSVFYPLTGKHFGAFFILLCNNSNETVLLPNKTLTNLVYMPSILGCFPFFVEFLL